MTLRDEILAKCSTELVASKDFAAIAARVSEGRTKQIPCKIGRAAVLDAIDADHGAEIIYGLRDLGKLVPAVGVAYELLCANDPDIGNPKTRAKIDLLTGSMFDVSRAWIFTPETAAAIKALAVVADPVTPAQVEAALLDPNAWVTVFTPRRPGETVGSMSASRRASPTTAV